MKKSIFQWTIEEIKEWQIKNLIGGLKNWKEFSETVYNECRLLEKKGLVDEYLKTIEVPTGLHFIISHSNNYEIAVTQKGAGVEFWALNPKGYPSPITSNTKEPIWAEDLFLNKKFRFFGLLKEEEGELVKIYKKGHFN
ncbi:hypothetical protein ACXA18_09640 [Riemerella anatipestifer]|uniref:hypothetical protein n=1 Tax=Riemerella anatipestifer TaxID=34085 RepID=UPI00069BB77F|nr:hypothetical protein [Riemerella anatipestifer]